MYRLIPCEHWDYSLGELTRGVIRAFSPTANSKDSIAIPGVGRVLCIRSGRAALVISLRALGLRKNASIGVPLYCCPVVLSAIRTAGFRPCFLDVDPLTYCLSSTSVAARRSKLDAVIAVHMFGNLCDIPALRRAAPAIPIIEDCAQAPGSLLQGRAAGTLSDVAVFSFRSGKYVSAGEGGAVYCNSPVLETRILALIRELKVPSPTNECIHIAKTWLRSVLRRKPLWGLVGSAVWSVYNQKTPVESRAPIVLTQIYASDRATAALRLPTLSACIARQRQNADYYMERLNVGRDMLCRETPGTFANRMQFPLLFKDEQQCEDFARRLHLEGVSTARPYKDIAATAARYYGYGGDCPQAERIARGVLVIPCNYALRRVDLERIVASANRAWVESTDLAGRAAVFGAALMEETLDKHQIGTVAGPHHLS